jgi:large subunit ribosomal protein L29
MDASELHDLDIDELRRRGKDLEDQLFRMRMQKSMGQLDAPIKIRLLRRDRARVLTVLREKEGK